MTGYRSVTQAMALLLSLLIVGIASDSARADFSATWIERWLAEKVFRMGSSKPAGSAKAMLAANAAFPRMTKIVPGAYGGGRDAADHPAEDRFPDTPDASADAFLREVTAEPPALETAGDWAAHVVPLMHGAAVLPDGPFDFERETDLSDRVCMADPRVLDAFTEPTELLWEMGRFPVGVEGRFHDIEIQVSHSRHEFKLFGTSFFGKREVLYECRVGLGSRSFPTPVGVYFVTHIYDDDPWWIPPQNRAWAWGQSPSKRVYGGTMAPLLKKRLVRSRNNNRDVEELIERKVRLDDYGYRFHGTNAPRSIGRNQSHGCVRMLPKDAAKVAKLIKEYVGGVGRSESENGEFVLLSRPVRLNLIR